MFWHLLSDKNFKLQKKFQKTNNNYDILKIRQSLQVIADIFLRSKRSTHCDFVLSYVHKLTLFLEPGTTWNFVVIFVFEYVGYAAVLNYVVLLILLWLTIR